MTQGQFCADALLGVSRQHFPHEVQGLRVEVLVALALKTKIHLFVFPVDFVIFRPLEERLLDEQDVEDDSQGEDVALWLDMAVLGQTNDLWSHVAWCSASVVQIFGLIHVGRKPEVSNDRIKGIVASEHDVLRFEVPVHDPALMHLCKS